MKKRLEFGLVTIALLTACAMCGGNPDAPGSTSITSTGSDAGAGGGVTTSKTTSHPATSAGGGQSSSVGGGGGTMGAGGSPETDTVPDGPCLGWKGWRQFHEAPTTPRACVPTTNGALPEPFQWDPCPASSGLQKGCRVLRATWPNSDGFPVAAPGVDLRHSPPLLALTRGAKDYRMVVLGEIDGPTRVAILDAEPGAAGVLWTQINHGLLLGGSRALAQLINMNLPATEYLLRLDADAASPAPSVEWAWSKSDGHGIGAGAQRWVTNDEFEIGTAAWGEPWQLIYSGTKTGRQQGFPYVWDDFVVWYDGNYPYSSDFRAFTPEKGVYSFIAYPGDSSQGVMGLGTDGKDMVWVHGHDRKPNDPMYPVQDLMVSPFTTDPAQIQPRRLRSHPTSYPLTSAYAVGCGYAAYSPDTGITLVVRISDGWTWFVPKSGCSLANGFCTDQVLGINCDELFVQQVATPVSVARIRLDALGPGQPPD